MAKPRCTRTTKAGSSSHTTTAPRAIWIASRTGTRVAGSRKRRWRCHSQATAGTAKIRALVTAAARRWAYSIKGPASRGGTSCPWQVGQSGQPSPEPVTRTTAPAVMVT